MALKISWKAITQRSSILPSTASISLPKPRALDSAFTQITFPFGPKHTCTLKFILPLHGFDWIMHKTARTHLEMMLFPSIMYAEFRPDVFVHACLDFPHFTLVCSLQQKSSTNNSNQLISSLVKETEEKPLLHVYHISDGRHLQARPKP